MVEAPRTPEEFLRERNQMFGSHFPVDADLFLCELNRKVCSIKGETASWTYRVGDSLVWPAFTFIQTSLNREYFKKQDESVSDIVTRVRGCTTFDSKCRESIRNLNDGDFVFAPDYRGSLEIPVAGYKSSITLSLAANVSPKQMQALQTDMRRWLPKTVAVLKFGDTVEIGRDRGVKFQAAELTSEPPDVDRWTILRAINHPLIHKEALPQSSDANVAVIDSYVFPHCHFTSRITFQNAISTSRVAAKPSDCPRSKRRFTRTIMGRTWSASLPRNRRLRWVPESPRCLCHDPCNSTVRECKRDVRTGGGRAAGPNAFYGKVPPEFSHKFRYAPPTSSGGKKSPDPLGDFLSPGPKKTFSWVRPQGI